MGGEMQKRNYIHKRFIFGLTLLLSFSSQIFFSQEKSKIEKIGGVEVISNPKFPIYKDGLKIRLVFKEELSIGQIEGDENYMFGAGISFTTDEEGNFYVSDLVNHRIMKYDPKGMFLFSFGRDGQGPGEFRSVSVVKFDKKSNLYITDGINRRISFFNKKGEFLRQIRLQERYENLYINSKNFVVANKWNLAQEANVNRQTSLYGLFDDNFNLVVELFKDELESTMPKALDESSIVDFLAKLLSMAAFKPQVVYTLSSDDFIYLGYPEKYEINVYSPEGKPVKKIGRDYESIPVRKQDKENFVNIAVDGFSSQVFTAEIKKKAFPKIKYPKYKPAYKSFCVMENGWLSVIVDSVENEYTLFDIFDQKGKYIAHFKTPILAEGLLSEHFFFKNGKAYAVVTESDYKFVKRYSYEIQEYKFNE